MNIHQKWIEVYNRKLFLEPWLVSVFVIIQASSIISVYKQQIPGQNIPKHLYLTTVSSVSIACLIAILYGFISYDKFPDSIVTLNLYLGYSLQIICLYLAIYSMKYMWSTSSFVILLLLGIQFLKWKMYQVDANKIPLICFHNSGQTTQKINRLVSNILSTNELKNKYRTYKVYSFDKIESVSKKPIVIGKRGVILWLIFNTPDWQLLSERSRLFDCYQFFILTQNEIELQLAAKNRETWTKEEESFYDNRPLGSLNKITIQNPYLKNVMVLGVDSKYNLNKEQLLNIQDELLTKEEEPLFIKQRPHWSNLYPRNAIEIPPQRPYNYN